MSETTARPPWLAVALFLLAIIAAGGWMMLHTYDVHDLGECGRRYAGARTAADSARVNTFLPDSERTALQPRPCGVLRGPTPEEFREADSLVTGAIAATGGDSALTALGAIEWEGSATLHGPGGDVPLEGTWRVAPPDTAVITTWSLTDPARRRRVVITATEAWADGAGDSAVMSATERRDTHELLFDYSLLRLVTLRMPGVTVRPLPASGSGRPGILVRTPGRLDVALYFGEDGRVARLRTRAAPAPGAPLSQVDVTLEGVTEIAGVRWFRELRVERDGRPALDLTITAAHPATGPATSWIAPGAPSN